MVIVGSALSARPPFSHREPSVQVDSEQVIGTHSDGIRQSKGT
jgi:hypothetical protein